MSKSKDDSTEIDKLVEENRCWTCKCELDQIEDEKYECPECNRIYLSCLGCEKLNNGKPCSMDVPINDKGESCAKCNHHFCIFCWQSSDFDWDTGEMWMCDDCLKDKKIQKKL